MATTFVAGVRLCPVSNSNAFSFLRGFVKVIVNNGYFITAFIATVFNSERIANASVSYFGIFVSILKPCHTHITLNNAHNGSARGMHISNVHIFMVLSFNHVVGTVSGYHDDRANR